MLFSELQNIDYDEETELWFNPILHQDTRLFIDPFLVFKNQDGMFSNTYNDMMEFFNKVFNLVASSGENKKSNSFMKAVAMLSFHEVDEICLGYSPNREGAGPGFGFAKKLADNIHACIQHGITNLKHFEEIGLFHNGVGPDNISDMTANLMKNKLVIYTQTICREKGIPMEPVKLKNAFFNFQFLRWEDQKVILPVNPFSKTGVLLVPKNFLRELPEINKDDFWASAYESLRLRLDLNFEIGKNLKKEEIARIAIENYDIVVDYVSSVEGRPSRPYNLHQDLSLKYKWYSLAKNIIQASPLLIEPPSNEEELAVRVEQITRHFVDFVELNAGYKLIWDEKMTKSKSESAVQLLFHGIVQQHCIANGIDLSREVNQGRGPVDFKFSNGYQKKVLLEIKLANNTQFWHGLKEQLPFYMKADSTLWGFFLVIAYRKEDFERFKLITEEVKKVNVDKQINIKAIIVDATPRKPSASNL